jgi:large subunit ribosomal protein L15
LYALEGLEAGEVTITSLKAAGLVPPHTKKVKIVKKGEVTKAFILKGVLATAGAKAAVEAAGGSISE